MIRAAEQIPTKRNGNAFLEAEERVCALERAFASGISFCSGVSAGAAVPVSVCAAGVLNCRLKLHHYSFFILWMQKI